MHNSIYLSPAKINLFLHIIDKRHDNYHNIQTIFTFIDYYDKLVFTKNNDDALSILGSSSISYDDNLALKAAKLLKNYTKTKQGVNIQITKNIPLGAGLGGGSSNCASTLLALNELWQTNLPLATLAKIGVKLGADVPVFIYKKNSWAEGVGDELTNVLLAKHYFLVVYPNKNASTKTVFNHKKINFSRKITKILTINNIASDLANTKNDCLDASCYLYPEINEVFSWFNSVNKYVSSKDIRTIKPKLSGSGSSVFVCSKNKNLLLKISKYCPKKWQYFIAQSIS